MSSRELDRPPFAPEDVLLYRPPMLLLARLGAHTDDSLEAEIEVSHEHPFAADGHVPALLAIEYLAQTVAAHEGIADRAAGRPHGEGLLLGSRAFSLHRDHFDVGERLRARIERDFNLGNEFGRYRCRLFAVASGDCVAEGEVKVFQSEALMQALKGGVV